MEKISIYSKPSWKLIDVPEMIRYRELLYIFTWRDLKVRYKQTLLGILWVLFQPLITMVIFTVFFGRLAKIPSGNLPYSLFVLCGIVFWTFFSSSLSHASDSMVMNESIIKKVYFPKIILPLSSVLTSFIDLSINLILLFIYGLVLGFVPNIVGLGIILLGIILTSITSLGLSFFLASINVKYRDVRYILPFFIQLLLFLTPIIYPLAIVSGNKQIIMAFNPMTTVVEFTRFAFSNSYKIEPQLFMISLFSSLLILFFGLWYFRKTEQFFADIV